MAQRSCMRSAPALVAWIQHVFTTGGCGTQGELGSAGRQGDRRAIRGFRYQSELDIRYACWRAERRHAAEDAAVVAGALGAGGGSAVVSGVQISPVTHT